MASLIKTAVDIANGRHALSRYVIFGLWLADAVLCGLIIWKVPCQSHP
jgi:alpha-1,3-mannosyltransferase